MPLVIAIIVLLTMLVAFARDLLKPSAIAVIGASVFLALGYVPQDDMLAVFSNAAVIAVAAMMVLSQALVRTGTLEALATRIVTLGQEQPRLAVVVLMLVAMVASAFLNSTPVVMIMIPLTIALAATIGASARRFLIPLSYLAILGGTCTLIGTSTNLLVNAIARREGHAGFSLFDITPVGLAAAATGVVFLLLGGRFLLPSDDGKTRDAADDAPVDIITECRITDDFDDIGTAYADLALLKHRGLLLVRALRDNARLPARDPSTSVAAGDRLILRASAIELATLASTPGLDLGVRVRKSVPTSGKVARFTVVNNARVAGRRIRWASFLALHPVSVLGVKRHRVLAGPDLANLVVKAGDEIWIRGDEDSVDAILADPYFVPSSVPVAKPFLRNKALFAILTLVLVIASAAIGWVPLPVAAVIGIGFLLAIQSLDTEDAWSALDLDVLILIYAMLIVGVGLEKTGVVDAVVNGTLPVLTTLPPLALLIAIYFLTSVLTETITNNGVAVIMTPIVMTLATELGVEPTPLIVSVMFAASASFATPVGYQTNTLVHIAGNYRFGEFLRIGIPMNVVVGLATCVAIHLWFG
jgi:di/tricarboxylate transporter